MKTGAASSISFRAAILNINAASDSHGQLNDFANFWAETEKNKEDIFLKDGAGRKNVFAIAGDWFMSGNVKGYKSNPDYNSQKYQLMFFNKFIHKLHTISRSVTTIFTPGNHEFDAGEREFANTMAKLRSHVVATNIDFENSPALLRTIGCNKIAKSKIIQIKDDKNPGLLHNVLFVGVVPGNMSYYNKNLKDIQFLDNVHKPQSKLTPEDVQNTVNAVKKEINDFKLQYPKGAVVLLDHFGTVFREETIRQKLPIDVILGAHQHFDEESITGSTHIVELYQNFKKLENIKIFFDDNGDIKDIQTKALYPDDNGHTEIDDFYQTIFKEDIAASYYIPANEDVNLSVENVRTQSTPLANFVVDVIMNQIVKQYPDTDFFALNASAIRGSLKTEQSGSINNIDIISTLNGIRYEDADIVISKLTGAQILDIICDNLLFNSKNPQKNPLMHYSGLKIDKAKLLEGLSSNLPQSELIKFVINIHTAKPLNPDETYNFANVEKFFIKSKNRQIQNLREEKTQITNLNAKDAFSNYFKSNSKDVVASNEKRY